MSFVPSLTRLSASLRVVVRYLLTLSCRLFFAVVLIASFASIALKKLKDCIAELSFLFMNFGLYCT